MLNTTYSHNFSLFRCTLFREIINGKRDQGDYNGKRRMKE